VAKCCNQTQPDVPARHKVCQGCPRWAGRCLKNFNLNSFMGCPEKKFPPVGNAGYAPDIELKTGVSNPDCCGKQVLPAPPIAAAAAMTSHVAISGSEVMKRFASSMIEWRRRGFPVVPPAQHETRYSKCQPCQYYRGFLCQKCMCIAYLKTKLATETCPDVPPRWT
jgi:hypothetical protein